MGTIKSCSHTYDSIQQWAEDIRKVWDNALLFNAAGVRGRGAERGGQRERERERERPIRQDAKLECVKELDFENPPGLPAVLARALTRGNTRAGNDVHESAKNLSAQFETYYKQHFDVSEANVPHVHLDFDAEELQAHQSVTQWAAYSVDTAQRREHDDLGSAKEEEAALEFIRLVKQRLGAGTLHQFTEILHAFKARSIDVHQTIEQVCRLFAWDPQLIEGLYQFLPEDTPKSELTPQEQLQRCVQKESLPLDAYASAVNLSQHLKLLKLQKPKIKKNEIVQAAASAYNGDIKPENFVPIEFMHPSHAEKKKHINSRLNRSITDQQDLLQETGDGDCYVSKRREHDDLGSAKKEEAALKFIRLVKQRLGAGTLHQFTEILQAFKARSIDVHQTMEKVCRLFAWDPQLIEGLYQFLPKDTPLRLSLELMHSITDQQDLLQETGDGDCYVSNRDATCNSKALADMANGDAQVDTPQLPKYVRQNGQEVGPSQKPRNAAGLVYARKRNLCRRLVVAPVAQGSPARGAGQSPSRSESANVPVPADADHAGRIVPSLGDRDMVVVDKEEEEEEEEEEESLFKADAVKEEEEEEDLLNKEAQEEQRGGQRSASKFWCLEGLSAMSTLSGLKLMQQELEANLEFKLQEYAWVL